MNGARAFPLLAIAVVAGASACGSSDTTATTALPTCATEGRPASNGVVLMAQSVPTASWIPCLRTALPLGWSFQHLDARNGVSRFLLNSDRDGQKAIEVRLDDSCHTAGSTEILSDREGMRRLERVTRTTPHFEGKRYYVFDGGCITIVFNLSGDNPGEPLALATQAVGSMSRAALQDQVHQESNGRLTLDPPRTGER